MKWLSNKNLHGKARSPIVLALLGLFLISIALRWPLVAANDRFFRDEDDAHHFNRVVEMVKRRGFNPHYFNKPSLHFYLRMPVVVVGYVHAKALGEISAISDIRTRDPFGISGYAFTASHPTIVRWSRLFSVLLTTGLVCLTFIVALQLGCGVGYATLAGLITTLSPEVLRNSHLIGVDVLMALLCLLTTAVGIRALRQRTRGVLITTGLLAGLAGAAKYNALPIISVPLIVWACQDRSRLGLLLVGLALPLGFLFGCPYSIVSWREFMGGVSYEAWHYAIASHEGHTSNPGMEQALFYLSWLIHDGVGRGAAALAVCGLILLIKKSRPLGIVFLCFPLTYALFMIFQRTNFTRNMVALVPYASIMASCGFGAISKNIRNTAARRLAAFGCVAILIVPNWLSSWTFLFSQMRSDSREEIGSWISDERPEALDVAIAGPLQVPPHLFSLPGIDAFNPKDRNAAALIQMGYDYVVTSPRFVTERDRPLVSVIKEIPGAKDEQRFPDSPFLQIYKLKASNLVEAFIQSPATVDFGPPAPNTTPRCYTANESHCWLMNKRTIVKIGEGPRPSQESFMVEVMTPWPNQRIAVLSTSGTTLYEGPAPQPNTWGEISFTIPKDSPELIIQLSQVHSPESRSTGRDRRRLGLAIRQSRPLS